MGRALAAPAHPQANSCRHTYSAPERAAVGERLAAAPRGASLPSSRPVAVLRRLRSEAFTASRLASQLDEVGAEFVRREQMVKIDRIANRVSVTSILSWNADHFIAAYDPGASGPYAARSPIERALVAFITPHLFPLEREFIEENKFSVVYHPFDWRLNDATS